MSLTPEQLAKIQQKESTLPDALRRDALTNYREGYFFVTINTRGYAPILSYISGRADANDGAEDEPRCVYTELGKRGLSGKVLWMFFLFHSILYLCIMNMLEQLARIVLPKEILDNFDIVKIETDESDIDSMSMTIYLDERMNAYFQKFEDYESKGFMDAVRITDFPIRDHKVILVLRRRRWKNKETGETFVDRISVTESGTRYSKEFAAFLKETYGHIPDDLPYA